MAEYYEPWRMLQPLGHEVLIMLAHIARTSQSTRLRSHANKVGHHLALKWWKRISLPRDPHELFSVAAGAQAAASLGVTDKKFQHRLTTEFNRQDIQVFLRFSPWVEQPPRDLPEDCPECFLLNPRATKRCISCGQELECQSRYASWTYALVVAHHCDRFGLHKHARLFDVARCVANMRPYPKSVSGLRQTWDIAFAVTHFIYIMNDYCTWQLRPNWLRAEYGFLRRLIAGSEKMYRVEILGECVDTLASFGHSRSGRVLKPAINFLKSSQNQDGSWGLPSDDDYRRLHTTMVAVDAIREHRWKGLRRPPHLQLRS